jgi:hypothetical protein
MPCKPYKDALTEAAASGAHPQGELRAHLAGCADCRAALEQEQSLFDSIDNGLHVAANAEVPASLLPRLRARLDEESVPRRSWVSNWLVLASAAALVVAFFTARVVWRINVVHQPVQSAEKPVVPHLGTATPQNGGRQVETPMGKNDVSNHQLVIAKSHSVPESLVKGKSTPEVLVPRDQELLLAEYAEQWSLHKRPLLLAQEFDATILSPLRVSPIQIDELDVKLLAEEKSQ